MDGYGFFGFLVMRIVKRKLKELFVKNVLLVVYRFFL